MYKLPSGYAIYGTSNNGATLTAVKSDSTAAKPKILILDRKEGSYNQNTGRYSVPEFRVRVLVGTIDSVSGMPRAERLLTDCSFRTPVGSETDHTAWYADFKSMIDDADFLTDAIGKHLFPDCCEDSE